MEKISHLQLLVLKFWSWISSRSRWVHKNRVYIFSPCLSPPQLVELCANKAVWCERSWDCHGIQTLGLFLQYGPSKNMSLWQVTRRQDFTDLQIPGNYLHTGNFWERVGQDAWEGVATGSSKQNTAGVGTGQSYGRGRECPGHGFAFQHHLWYLAFTLLHQSPHALS